MINRILVVILLLVALSFNDAMACSCVSKGSFVEYARQSEGVIRAKIVRHGRKLSHGDTLYESMSVEVVAVLKGDLEFESIELLGDPGFLCRDFVDSRVFVVGKEFLIALHGDEAVQPFGGCGEAWLALAGDVARGSKWEDGELLKYTIKMDEVIRRLHSP